MQKKSGACFWGTYTAIQLPLQNLSKGLWKTFCGYCGGSIEAGF
jgi:peptide methionine sulfoxide reductase MsrA